MIITIKNLQQQTFTIDFEPENTVLELKKKIHVERGPEYVVEKQKLIYAGVILDDDRTVASYKVDDKKFIVVMLKRDIGGSTVAASGGTTTSSSITATIAQQQKTDNCSNSSKSSETVQQSSSSNTEKIVKPESETPTPEQTTIATKNDNKGSTEDSRLKAGDESCKTETQTATDKPTSNPSGNSGTDLVGELANASLQNRAESNLLMGDEYNRSVESMVEMGYPRAQVERAMAASFNNPERAVEYLITGIPEGEDAFNAVAANDNPTGDGSVERSGSLTGGAIESPRADDSNSDPFEFLRSQPQFLQMRSLVYQNPDLLHAVLQQIGQSNPALLQLISENQDAFLNMLNQPLDSESPSDSQQRIQAGARSEDTNLSTTQRTDNSNVGQPPAVTGSVPNPSIAVARENNPATEISQSEGMAAIRLSSQDQDAVNRLKALGFPEALVLQAYFACEKDEQLAANFLLSSAFDD